MHPLFQKASGLTEGIIGAAIEVHRDKGPGLIESIYEWCLTKEFELRGLPYLNQSNVVVTYKGFTREEPLRDETDGRRSPPHPARSGPMKPQSEQEEAEVAERNPA